MARWRKRKEWWNEFPSIALIVLYAAGAAPTQISLRLNWSKNSTKFVRKTKTRSSSIWVFINARGVGDALTRKFRLFSNICAIDTSIMRSLHDLLFAKVT